MAIPHAPYIQPRRHPHVEAYFDEDNLPDSDGKPMSETDRHRNNTIGALNPLEEFFRSYPDVYVTGNIFVYYPDEAGKIRQVSPDIFIVRGVPKHERRYYRVDKEGKAPEVVIELTSRKTKRIDQVTKPAIYAYLGVKEYFLFDPYKETMTTCLRGFRLQDGAYVRMPDKPSLLKAKLSKDQPLEGLKSEVLGLELRVEEGQLRLYDPKLGERLRTHKESEADRRAAEARAAAAETEAARLREELAKLQMKSKKRTAKEKKKAAS